METFQRFLKIFGPLIGIILVYFIVRYAVTQFQSDADTLSKVSPATMSEVTQDPAILASLEEPTGDETAEDDAAAAAAESPEAAAMADEAAAAEAEADVAADDAAADEALAEASADEAAAEEATAEGDAEVAAADEEAAAAAVDEANTDEAATAAAAEEASTAETEAEAEGEVAAAGSEEAAVEEVAEEAVAASDDQLVDAETGEAVDPTADDGAVDDAADDESTAAEPADENADPLSGQRWLLTSISDAEGNEVELTEDGEYNALFNDGRLSGSTVCGNYAGKYQADGDALAIAISATAATANALESCDGGAAFDESETYLATLQSAATFAVEAGELTISDEDGVAILAFASESADASADEAVTEVDDAAADATADAAETPEPDEAAAADEAATDEATADEATAQEATDAPADDEPAAEEEAAATDDPYAGLPAGVAEAMAMADASRGEQLTLQQACIGCHNFDPDMQMVGPTWYNIAETAAGRVEGQSAIEYLYTSIVNTNEYIVEGYQPNIMLQTYGDTLSDQDLADIISYLLEEGQ